jgi:hypothetical protein
MNWIKFLFLFSLMVIFCPKWFEVEDVKFSGGTDEQRIMIVGKNKDSGDTVLVPIDIRRIINWQSGLFGKQFTKDKMITLRHWDGDTFRID